MLEHQRFTPAWATQVGQGATPNPATAAQGTVVTSTRTDNIPQRLSALDEASGVVLWSYDFGAIHGVHPPAIRDGRVFVTTSGHQDSFLWSFDATTGEVLFRSSYPNQWGRAFAPVVAGGNVYINTGTSGMGAWSASDGEEQWFTFLNQYDAWTPAVRDGMVYAYTGLHFPKVSVVEASTGTTLFEIEDPAFLWNGWSMHTAPVLGSRQNLIAVQPPRLVSFDLVNRSVAWEEQANYHGTGALADGVLYVFNSRQLEARGEADGSLLWAWVPPLGATPRGAPLVTKNLVFVSTDHRTYGLHIGSHDVLWETEGGGSLALTRAGRLLIAQSDGVLKAIRLR